MQSGIGADLDDPFRHERNTLGINPVRRRRRHASRFGTQQPIRDHEPARSQTPRKTGKGLSHGGFSHMREHRLGYDEVEIDFEYVGLGAVIVIETGTLDPARIFTQFMSESVIDQPSLGVDTEIAVGIKIGDRHPSQSKRTATEVQQAVMAAQAQQEQQSEL